MKSLKQAMPNASVFMPGTSFSLRLLSLKLCITLAYVSRIFNDSETTNMHYLDGLNLAPLQKLVAQQTN